jgi:hypothetical protein
MLFADKSKVFSIFIEDSSGDSSYDELTFRACQRSEETICAKAERS